MHIIDPSFRILDDLDQASLAVRIEYCGRICYKSEHRIDPRVGHPLCPQDGGTRAQLSP